MAHANIRPVDDAQTSQALSHGPKLRQRHLIALPHWVLRGLWEMIRARIGLSRIAPGDIASLNAAAFAKAGSRRPSCAHNRAIGRVAFIIALLGRKLPWRSDCLIQAIAAQRWLAQLGIATKIIIGVERPQGDELGAHAWLVDGETVILGGDIERYRVLIGET